MSLFLLMGNLAWANLPGGGTNGPNVGIVDNGSTVTMTNGIAAIVITKSSADIYTMNYTFNNTGNSQTLNLLAGGSGGSGGYLYWFQNPGTFITGPFTETVVSNTANYAEISLYSTSATNGTVDIHFSMQRGSPGFYTTAIVTHRSSDGVMHIELRPNIYAGSIFNWMSVDAARNRVMEVSSGSLSIPAPDAPKECYLWTNGIYAGQYEDKYKYSANLASLPAWGWSSVGTGGYNVGIWDVSPSAEYYPGGPLVRQLMEHIGTTILNVFTGNYYGMSTDGGLNPGETWFHVYGPYFYYFNAVTNTLASSAAAQSLYNDALAQGAAEQTAWPYSWFNNTNYVPASGRGTVSGKIVITDSGNPNASAANLWVGLEQQPATNYDSVYDFQQWMKRYHFWVKTDTNGNFTIPNVLAGTNYTLYAFGPGTPDTFMSQAQMGGSPPLIVDYPASQFGVNVTGGATNNLGTNIWTPTRVGATVFEIGYPDRTAAKFRHGDDYWVGDIGPSPTAPSPIWSKWLEYAFDFPTGVNYFVGQSRWSTDWNFIQPVVSDSQGNFNDSSSTITFTLASAPANGATASLYLGLTSDYYSAVVVSVNGNNLGNVSGVTGTPNNSIPTTGYYVGYGGSDTSIREGNNGAFSDERLTFPASQLHAGVNTINLSTRQIGGSYFANHFMYDYLRLELTGYVPPPPASIAAYPGNNCNLVSWPVTPGAAGYNILRSTTSGSGYVSITNGVTGPVCGSGSNNAAYLDSTATNNTTYYYAVRSANPTGASTNSPPSAGTTPLASISTSAPATPTGLTVVNVAHQSVKLNWSAVANAAFYTVYRSTLFNNGGGASNVLGTIVLANNVTNATYTDTSPTDGSIYRYAVAATGAGGTSTNSISSVAVPKPSPPVSLPPSLFISSVINTNPAQDVTLTWNAVAGAVGYAIYRATSSGGPYVFLQSVTTTTYFDGGLATNQIYYYRVVALNSAGVSANASDLVNPNQAAPSSLAATAANAQITLTWSAPSGATSYTLKRGTGVGNETNTVVSGYVGTTYTNTGLINGTTYYYVVTAVGGGGTSGNSPEASATPTPAASGIWTADASANWSTAANWSGGTIAYGSGNTADFSTISLTADRTVTLDSDRIISGLIFGDASASHNWMLAGTNTLTLGTSPDINVDNQTTTISTVIAGSTGLTKTGLGVLTLGGAAETFTNGLAVNAGTLTLDFSNSNSPATNIISATNGLTLGGGLLQITGGTNAASSQTFAGTMLDAGGSGISAAPVSGASNPAVALGDLTVQLGGSIRLVGPATIGNSGNAAATASITTTTAGVGGTSAPFGLLLGSFPQANATAAYATVGLYDWASTDTSSGGAGTSPYLIIGGSQVSGFYSNNIGYLVQYWNGNFDLTANGTTPTGNPQAATVRFNTPSATNLTERGDFLVSGFLITPNLGTHNASILVGSGGGPWQIDRFTTPNGNQEGVIWQNNTLGYFTMNPVISDGRDGTSDPNWIVKAGQGTVVFASTTSTYTGQTFVNEGNLLITANGAIGDPASAMAVNLNGGTLLGNATFTLDNGGSNPRPVNLIGNGGGLAATASNTMTVDGLVSGSGPLSIGIPASSANGNVAGLLPGTGTGTANATPVYATGTVVLSDTNTFTGGLNVDTGTLVANLNNNINNPTSGALGNTSVARNIIVNSGGTLDFALGNAMGSTLTTMGATLVINSGATVTDTANDIETLGPVQLNGGTLTGTGGAYAAFQMYALEGTVTVGGSSPSTISGPSNGISGYHLAAPTTFNVAEVTGGAGLDLNVSGILVDQDGAGTVYGHLGAPGSLTKTGAGTMTLSATNAYTGGTAINAGVLNISAPETAGISGPLGKSGTIIFGGGILQYSATNQFDYSARFSTAANQAVSIDTAGQNVTFAAALTSSGGTLTKLGNGTLTLSGTNTFTGGTVIGGGTLMVSNSGGSATGTGNVTVQYGGTLGGSGAVSGAVTVNAGGALAPGNPLGILTVSNNLTLADGSRTQVQIQHSPLTNDAVKISGTLTEGGTLVVTNSGAAAFTAGDSFELFSAANYAGTFGSISLPALNSGLYWSTAQLAVDGSLTVVSSNPPATTGVGVSSGNLIWHGTGGTPNWNYYVLSSTNLTLPLAQWTVTATNQFDAGGNFTCTNAVTGTNGSQQFYILKVQ